MIKGILSWITGACFGLIGNIWESTIEKVTFNQAGLQSLLAIFNKNSVNVAGASKTATVNISNIISVIAWIIIFGTLIITALEAIAVPVSGREIENPLKSVFRVGVVAAMILLIPAINKVLFSLLDSLLNSSDLPTPDMSNLFKNIISYDNLSDSNSNMIYLLGTLTSIGMLSQFVAAIITYLERFIMFGIYIDLLPIAIAYSASPTSEDVTKDYFKTMFAQIIGLVITKILFIAFAMQVEAMGNLTVQSILTPSTGPETSFYLQIMLCGIILSIITSVERILQLFGLRSYPTGIDATELAAHTAKGLATARGAVAIAKDTLSAGKAVIGAGSRTVDFFGGKTSPLNGDVMAKRETEGRKFASSINTLKADSNGVLSKVDSNGMSDKIRTATGNAIADKRMTIAEARSYREGAESQMTRIANATDNVRHNQLGTRIDFDPNTSRVSNLMARDANGNQLNAAGSVSALSQNLESGKYESLTYTGGEGKDFSKPIDMQRQDGSWQSVDFSGMSKEEAGKAYSSMFAKGQAVDAKYVDTDGNVRQASIDDTASTHGNAEDAYLAYGLDSRLGDDVSVAKDSSAKYMDYRIEAGEDGAPRIMPSAVAIGTHREGKGNEINVINTSGEITGDLAGHAATEVVDPDSYTTLSDHAQMVVAPTHSYVNVGQGRERHREEDATWTQTVDDIFNSHTSKKMILHDDDEGA